MILVAIGPLTFDAGPTAGASQWICQNLDGWFSAPPMRGSTDDHPVADGAFGSIKNYRSARSLTFTGTLVGKSQSDAQQTLYDAFAALQPDGVPFTLSVTTELGMRSLQVTLDGVPTVEPHQGLTAADVTANLIAYDPVKYGPTTTQLTGTPTAGGGLEYALGDVGGSVGSASGALFYGALGNLGRISLTNNGTAAIWPVFNITGGLPGGFYIQCLETGAVVQYSSIVPAGTTVTLDMGAETVSINGIQGGDNFLTQLNWFSVPPKSTITVQINPIAGTTGSPTLGSSVADGFW